MWILKNFHVTAKTDSVSAKAKVMQDSIDVFEDK